MEGYLKPNPQFPIRLYGVVFDEVHGHLQIYFFLHNIDRCGFLISDPRVLGPRANVGSSLHLLLL